MPPLFDETANAEKNNLTIVRLLLATMVILSHCFPILSGSNHSELTMRLTRGQDSTGELAVDGFFALSGFLIVQSWLRSRSVGDYLKKRVLRIYPGFLAATLFCAFVVGPLAAANPQAFLTAVFQQGGAFVFQTLTLNYPHLPQVFPYLTINNSLWTIRYEFWCYLLVIGLGAVKIFDKARLFLLLLGAVFLAHTAQEWMIFSHGPNADALAGYAQGRGVFLLGQLDCWPRFLVYFLTGVAAYQFRRSIPRSPALLAACLLPLACAAVTGRGLNMLLPVCGVYALFYVCFAPRQWGKFITNRGDFSYGLYLYAFPVQQLLHFWFPAFFSSPYRLFFAAALLTFPFAVVSWYGVERPFLRLKPPR